MLNLLQEHHLGQRGDNLAEVINDRGQSQIEYKDKTDSDATLVRLHVTPTAILKSLIINIVCLLLYVIVCYVYLKPTAWVDQSAAHFR